MTTSIETVREYLNKSLYDDSKPWSGLLAWAEKTTGVKRIYLFIGSVIFVALYMVFGYAAQLFCNILGFLYPAYCSIRAIESTNKEDDTKWLTYWVVFAFFTIVEYPAQIWVNWFPFYWLIKCVFFVWCFIPIENNGSLIIYQRIIRPKYLQHQGAIKDTLHGITSSATRLATETITEALTNKKGE